MRRNQKMLSAVTVLALLLARLPAAAAPARAAEDPRESSPLTVTDNAGEAMLAEQSYSITYDYDLNGDNISEPANPTSYTSDTESFTLLIPERDGYTFAGWTGTGLAGATVTVLIRRGSTGDRHYTATWIEITDDYVPVTSISVERFDLNALPRGDCWKATAIVGPSYATNPGVLWTSSNPSAVEVDENGLIRAVWLGDETVTVTVTATTVDGGRKQTGEITVIDPKDITGSEVQIDRTSPRLVVGGTLRLYANSSPNADSVRWESEDTSVLTVGGGGTAPSTKTGCITAWSRPSAPAKRRCTHT